MENILKRLISGVLAGTMLLASNVTAYADDEVSGVDIPERHWVHWADCNPFRIGGVNQIDGVACKNKEETEALEERLRTEDYILITTDDKDITDEEYEMFCKNSFFSPPYAEFTNKSNTLFWEMKMAKVYIYRPSFDDAMSQIKENGHVKGTTQVELITSAVLINYSTWFFKDRVGQTLNEYDDDIPYWFSSNSTGYMLIESPIDVIIRFKHITEQNFLEIPVTGNVPRLVKMKEGRYMVMEINRVAIATEESTLNYNNSIQIHPEDTEENPYVLSITETVEKYDIEPMTPEEAEQLSEEEKDEKTLVEERTKVKEKEVLESQKSWRIIIFAVIAGIVLIVIIILLILKKKNSKYSKER